MQWRVKDREQAYSYFKCPRKAGLAGPNNADLIIICCKGAPHLHQVSSLRSLLSLPHPLALQGPGVTPLLLRQRTDKGTFVSVPELGIEEACFSWEVEDMVPVLQLGPHCLFISFL